MIHNHETIVCENCSDIIADCPCKKPGKVLRRNGLCYKCETVKTKPIEIVFLWTGSANILAAQIKAKLGPVAINRLIDYLK